MSLTIKTKSGKRIGLTDSQDEYIIMDNKKVLLSDIYSNDKLRKEFNDSIKEDKDNDVTE